MQKVLLTGVLASAISCSLYATELDLSATITSGQNVTTSEFNSEYSDFINLFYDKINYNGTFGATNPYCGATILNATHVLTAAHCFHNDDGTLDTENRLLFTSVARAKQKSDFPYSVDERIMVKSFYIHENYQHGAVTKWRNDIAILELESALDIDAVNDVVTPIADQTTYQNSANTFVAIGHGNQAAGIPSDGNLKYAELDYMTDAECQAADSGLTAEQMCLDGQRMGLLKKGVCQGDSGGPIYWNDGGVMKQVGIVSFAPTACGHPNASFVVGATELSDYAAWVADVLDGKAPTFTATDSARYAKLNVSDDDGNGGNGGGGSNPGTPGGEPSAPAASSSSGGTMSFWSLISLFALALFRRKQC